MREILFRGKTLIGEWVEGAYYKQEEFYGDKEDAHAIITSKDTLDNDLGLCYSIVLPDTIGQYTGLTDKNGKKVFEGDIVKCTDKFSDYEFIAVVMFGNPNGEYNWGFQLKRISGASANTDILLWVEMEETGAFIEVIGNIHDNPELLERGDNNAKEKE